LQKLEVLCEKVWPGGGGKKIIGLVELVITCKPIIQLNFGEKFDMQ
jgi:hypothetical protein